jgi:LacI family transcriptional regulator
MSTISDVAKRAGVSTMTVSRVVNNSGYISQETQERVEKAIAELGYVPNALARSLRFNQTKTIALVLTDITNPFFTTIARGVEDTASDAGYTVLFCNTDESIAEERKYLHMLLAQRVGGIILVPSLSIPESVEFVQEHDTPVVVLDRRIPGVQADVVRCDSVQGAYDLVRLLLSLGHERIAVFSGPDGTSTATDRVFGYRKALSEAGIDLNKELEFYGSFTLQSGRDMTVKAVKKYPRPTAIFAANNFIAIGALKALQELNIRVPEDIALVSFDDLPSALIVTPFLTVAAQPAYEMGKRAIEILLKRLSGGASDPCQEVVLPAEIVIRQSSGRRRN